jgi:hypothetical protein
MGNLKTWPLLTLACNAKSICFRIGRYFVACHVEIPRMRRDHTVTSGVFDVW